MARFARLTLPLVLIAGTASVAPAAPVGRGGPELADLLPEETLLYLSADARAFQTGLRSLGISGLLRDPEVRDFLAPLVDEVGGVDPADPIGALVDSLSLSEWIRGEAGIGVVGLTLHLRDGTPLRVSAAHPITARLLHELASNPDQGPPIARVALDFLASVEPGPALRGIVDGFLRDPPPGVEVGRVHMNGQSVTAVNVALEEGLATTIYADLAGDRWLVAGDQDRLGVAMTGGPGSPLVESSSWTGFSSRLKSQGNVLFAFADVAKGLGIVRNCIPPIVLEEASILGVDGLTGVGLGVSMTGGGVRESILLGFDGDPQGVLSLLDAFGGGFPALADAPAGTTAFVGARFDATTLLARVETLLQRIAPRLDRSFLADLRMGGPGGHDLLSEVLPAIGSDLSITVSPPRSGLLPDLVFSVGVRDHEKFERLLSTARSMAASEGGAHIKPLPLRDGPPGFVVELDDAPVQPSFVVRGDRLYGSVSPLSLKGYLHRHLDAPDRRTLSSTDGELLSVVDLVTGGRTELPTLLVAVDLERSIPYLYDTFAPFLPTALAESGLDLDAALLPLSDTLQPYFTGIAVAVSRGDEGVSIDLFTPTGVLPLGAAAVALDEMSRSGPGAQSSVKADVRREGEPD
ncbi:MAG: hypothetical protein ACF8XB_21645 [Planctomycetota bacterium JB042]